MSFSLGDIGLGFIDTARRQLGGALQRGAESYTDTLTPLTVMATAAGAGGYTSFADDLGLPGDWGEEEPNDGGYEWGGGSGSSGSDFDPFSDLFSPTTFEGDRTAPGGWDEGMMNQYLPGERGGTPRSVWEELMMRRKRFPLMDVASGLYGLSQSRGLSKEASRADPMSAYRSQYAQQLSQLAANPNQITTMPSYQAGQQAIERRLASQGYLGSGNMMQAMGKYGGDFFNQEIARLSALATPSPGAIEARVAGKKAATDLTGRSLASLGYGVWNMF